MCTSHSDLVCLLFAPSLHSTFQIWRIFHLLIEWVSLCTSLWPNSCRYTAWNSAIWQVCPYQVPRPVHSERLVLGLLYVVRALRPSGLHCQEACTVALLLHCLVIDVSGVAKMTSLYMKQKWTPTTLHVWEIPAISSAHCTFRFPAAHARALATIIMASGATLMQSPSTGNPV